MLKDERISDFFKYVKQFGKEIRNGHWDKLTNGIYLRDSKATIGSEYEHWAPDGLGAITDPNLMPTESLNYIIDILANNATQHAALYIAPFSGNVTPASTWTAANFTSNSTETTAYSETVRQTFTGSTPASGSANNTASRGVFTANTTNVLIYGAGLLSSSVKSGTTGVLASASKFTAVRTLAVSGDELNVGITLTATST